MHSMPSRSNVPINALEQLLRQCYSKPACSFKPRRCYSAQSEFKNTKTERPGDFKNVAIIGGGITGLASAHFLSKASPETRISLFEGGKRLGGWLHSEVVETGNGKVIFEKGPRTLRPNVPNGLLTLDLVGSIS